MKKFAKVKFIGNQNEYISGKNCNDWRFCKQCQSLLECNKEKIFLFIRGKEYNAYFLDYLQGVRDVLDVQAENSEVLSFIPLSDFQIVSDEENVLNENYALVKCIEVYKNQDLQVGKVYKALKLSPQGEYYYILDETLDCYFYPIKQFEIIEDAFELLKN